MPQRALVIQHTDGTHTFVGVFPHSEACDRAFAANTFGCRSYRFGSDGGVSITGGAFANEQDIAVAQAMVDSTFFVS